MLIYTIIQRLSLSLWFTSIIFFVYFSRSSRYFACFSFFFTSLLTSFLRQRLNFSVARVSLFVFFFFIVSLNFLSFFLLEAFLRARRYRIFDDRERKGERFADEEAEREEIRDAILKTRTGTTRSRGEDIVRVSMCRRVVRKERNASSKEKGNADTSIFHRRKPVKR